MTPLGGLKKKKILNIYLKFSDNKANFYLTVRSNGSYFFQYVLVEIKLMLP